MLQQLVGTRFHKVRSIQKNLSGCGRVELGNRPGGCGFSTPRFTHQPQSLTPANREVNAVYRADIPRSFAKQHTFFDGKMHFEVLNVQEDIFGVFFGVVSGVVRHESPPHHSSLCTASSLPTASHPAVLPRGTCECRSSWCGHSGDKKDTRRAGRSSWGAVP